MANGIDQTLGVPQEQKVSEIGSSDPSPRSLCWQATSFATSSLASLTVSSSQVLGEWTFWGFRRLSSHVFNGCFYVLKGCIKGGWRVCVRLCRKKNIPLNLFQTAKEKPIEAINQLVYFLRYSKPKLLKAFLDLKTKPLPKQIADELSCGEDVYGWLDDLFADLFLSYKVLVHKNKTIDLQYPEYILASVTPANRALFLQKDAPKNKILAISDLRYLFCFFSRRNRTPLPEDLEKKLSKYDSDQKQKIIDALILDIAYQKECKNKNFFWSLVYGQLIELIPKHFGNLCLSTTNSEGGMNFIFQTVKALFHEAQNVIRRIFEDAPSSTDTRSWPPPHNSLIKFLKYFNVASNWRMLTNKKKGFDPFVKTILDLLHVLVSDKKIWVNGQTSKEQLWKECPDLFKLIKNLKGALEIECNQQFLFKLICEMARPPTSKASFNLK